MEEYKMTMDQKTQQHKVLILPKLINNSVQAK